MAPITVNPGFQVLKKDLVSATEHFGDNVISKGIAKGGAVAGGGIAKGIGAIVPGDNIAAKFIKGIGGGVGGIVTGVTTAVENPDVALSGIIAVVTEDPINGAHAIAKSIKADCKEDAATCAGKIFTDIASIVIPGVGAAKIASKILD